ncbi:hypothetical protein GOP47_0008575 [Adiantum capillus-veneris]|uniref:HMA domain-containing protein n=1 Tax=Adiantum capillus-veneris TaxID=13818 RepID=A0A9D4ZKV5_ADICA|nr:hypothetical protein GOP47_0008575 [Adiantum capillus-veneris]
MAEEAESVSVELRVSMNCRGCERKVKRALFNLKGIHTVIIDRGLQKVVVKGTMDPLEVLQKVRRARKNADFWLAHETSSPQHQFHDINNNNNGVPMTPTQDFLNLNSYSPNLGCEFGGLYTYPFLPYTPNNEGIFHDGHAFLHNHVPRAPYYSHGHVINYPSSQDPHDEGRSHPVHVFPLYEAPSCSHSHFDNPIYSQDALSILFDALTLENPNQCVVM